MSLFNHYLPQDLDQITEHLENLHKATMGILNGAIKAEFASTKELQISIDHSLRILLALHNKKVKHDEFERLNNGVYARRGWLDEKINKS